MRAILPLLLAGSFSIPAPAVAPSDPRFESTVALAGDQVVWVEARGSASALVAPGRELLVLPPTGAGANRHDLAAGPGIALVQRLACTNSACTRNRGRDALRVDLQTGAAAPFDPCAECFYPREIFNQRFQLRGTVLAVGGARADGVFDLADGTSRTNLGDISAAAGRFAVVEGDSDLRLVDWRTGEQIRRVRDVYLDPLSNDVGLGEDGTIAWIGEGVQVLRPGDRRPRVVQPANDFITQPRIAGGRLAVRRIEIDGTSRIRVSALDGSGARTVDGQSGRSVDPRQNRVRLGVRRRAGGVGRPAVRAADDPGVGPGRESATAASPRPAARPRSRPGGSSSATGRRTLRVRLSCPAAPVDGCAGELSAHFTPAGAPRETPTSRRSRFPRERRARSS